jgi:hypothetical protein
MSSRTTQILAAVTVVAVALVGSYAALGGGSYKPLEVANPCEPRPLPPAEGFEEISQQVLLSGLDGAACRLRVTREELALAVTTEEGRQRFARDHKITERTLQSAVRSGLKRAVADAERAGRLSNGQASLLKGAVEVLPIGSLIDALRTGKGLVDAIGDFLGR